MPNIGALRQAFPQNLKHGGVFRPVEEARAMAERQNQDRHFLADKDIVSFPDGSQYALSNAWSKNCIGAFVGAARALGYDIKEVS